MTTTNPARDRRYWPEGMPRHLDYPDATVGDLVEGMAVTFGDRAAIVDGEVVLTYRELYDRACAVARALHRDGVGPGDVVLVHQPNSAWFPVLYCGVQLAGATFSPVNPHTPVPGLLSQLEDTAPAVVLTHPSSLSTISTALARWGGTDPTPRLVVVPPTAAAPASPEAEATVAGSSATPVAEWVDEEGTGRPASAAGPDDVAHLLFTGGTTGFPKGVRSLQRNVVANLTQLVAWRAGHAISAHPAAGLDLTPFDMPETPGVVPGTGATILVGPLYHTHSLSTATFLLLAGVTLVVLGRFSPEGSLEAIETHRATYLTGSPTVWHALIGAAGAANRDLTSVCTVSSGAAPLDRTTLHRLTEVFPQAIVAEGYGLTEGTCVISSAPPLRGAPDMVGSVGLPLCDTEIEIRDPLGRVLPTGERGEIWVRGPQVADGYHHRPAETAAQFVDGWLGTGDIGWLDERGVLSIADRAKDMLLYKGYNVYPRELEDLLLTHPDVDRAAVVGRDHPEFGQEPVAFVVPQPGRELDADALMAWVGEQVVPYKKIRAVHVMSALPTSAAGKVLKTALREHLPQ